MYYVIIGFLAIIASGALWAIFGPWAKRAYLVGLTLVSLSSCMTVGRVQRNCDKFFDVCVQTEREVVYRDTVIQIPPIPFKLPESKIDITLDLRIIDGKVNLPKQLKTMGLISTQVEIINNKLQVRSWLNDSTVLVKPDPVYIEGATKIITETRKVPIRYIPRIHTYALRIVLIQVALVALWVILKLKGLSPISILSKIIFWKK